MEIYLPSSLILFMPPPLKKLEGHTHVLLSACLSVCLCACASVSHFNAQQNYNDGETLNFMILHVKARMSRDCRTNLNENKLHSQKSRETLSRMSRDCRATVARLSRDSRAIYFQN